MFPLVVEGLTFDDPLLPIGSSCDVPIVAKGLIFVDEELFGGWSFSMGIFRRAVSM